MISLLKSKFDFFTHRVFFISADKLSVFHQQKGTSDEVYLFDNDDEGRKNFARYLKEWPNFPAYILVDIVEEYFRQDTIPHVSGSDRRALIERKRSRLFQDTTYFYAQNQGREEKGRRDDHFLFTAIGNDAVIKSWLALLEQHKVPLAGILSFPLLLQSYIRTLPDISNNALFITMQTMSGLRQTFFQKKTLKVSRLTQFPLYGSAFPPAKISDEVNKTQRYLKGPHLTSDDERLDIYFIADRALLNKLKKEPNTMPSVRWHFFSTEHLLGEAGSGVDQAVPFCDRLLVSYLLKNRPGNCYASAREMRYAKMHNVRSAMNVFSVYLILFCVLYSGFNFVNGLIYKREIAIAKNRTDYYQSRYDLLAEKMPKTPVTPAQVKIAIDAAATLKEYKETPLETLVFLGEVLEKFPSIKVDRINWFASTDPNSDSGITPANMYADNSLSSDSVVATADKYYQIATFEAHIEPFDGDYRAAIALVNEFVDALDASEKTQAINIESLPLDISSSAVLQGDAVSPGKQTSFSIRAVISAE